MPNCQTFNYFYKILATDEPTEPIRLKVFHLLVLLLIFYSASVGCGEVVSNVDMRKVSEPKFFFNGVV